MSSSPTPPDEVQAVKVIDTHTGGEPTRVIVAGAPDLGSDDLARRRERFRDEFDLFRSAVVNEPRGSDVLVGALLCAPVAANAAAGVIFFNNIGVLNMCGHGTIGVAIALGHTGQISPGSHCLETPVGEVIIELHDDRQRVTLENVPSYRHAHNVVVELPEYGPISGDVAWGGNWFFLVGDHGRQLEPVRVGELVRFTQQIKSALVREGITGEGGAEIDHIELYGPTENPDADARSFVLCPGDAWDRSPCGTGTSAKLACLAADGKLAPGERWRQESIIGSVFEAHYRIGQRDQIVPTLTGSAWVTAESNLLLDKRDPFCMGIRI